MLFGLLRLRPNPFLDRLGLACCLRTQQGVWMVSVRADWGLTGLGAGGFWLVLFLTVFSLGHLLGAP